jgi:hypothetical protein
MEKGWEKSSMSTLAALLTAAAVFGNLPLAASAEAREWLSLAGEWEGTGTKGPVVYAARYDGKVLRLTFLDVTSLTDARSLMRVMGSFNCY